MQESSSPERDAKIRLLASDLRKLKLEVGSPILRDLEERTGISKSALSAAFKGRTLPSERTLDSLIRAFGRDPSPWLDRRAELASQTQPTADPQTPTETQSPSGTQSPSESLPLVGQDPTPTSSSGKRTLSLRAAASLAAIAFGAGAAVATGLMSIADRDATVADARPTPNNSSMLPAATGVDPAATSCIDDAEPAASETRIETVVLQVMWSDKCQAGWGRITRNDNQSNGNSVHIEVYPLGPERDNQQQESTMTSVQGAYTHMIVRTDPDTRICAHGSITRDGETVDVGDELCT
jgi:transcriptional regulator with XRE-family HTH domain